MGIYHHPSIGTFHLNEAAPRRVVPGPERHSWASKRLLRGQSTTCTKCGCVRAYGRDYETRYQMPGQKFDSLERPPCTGPAAPAAPPAAPLSAAPAGPGAARDTPAPAVLPGLTAIPDEPAAAPYPTMHPEPPTTDDPQAPYSRHD